MVNYLARLYIECYNVLIINTIQRFIMKYNVVWNDLILEEGKLDPLAIWRVGDRIIGELFGPFTTVVMNRPARYVSMYSWIFYHLGKKNIDGKKGFWDLFFFYEFIFLCAIERHQNHNYPLVGRIGSEQISNFLNKQPEEISIIEMNNQRRVRGWTTNYKNMMQQLGLITDDPALPSSMKLTNIGNVTAQLYERSIKPSLFFQLYIDKLNVPLKVIDDLAKYSCPCLVHKPGTQLHRNERNGINNIYYYKCIKKNTLLWDSIHLLLVVLKEFKKANEKFTIPKWRQILSTGVLKDHQFIPLSERTREIFFKWQLYNLDSLFVYSLESALSGFLEILQKTKTIRVGSLQKFYLEAFESSFKRSSLFPKVNYIEDLYQEIKELNCHRKKELEIELIESIRNSTGEQKINSSFYFFLYIQSLFSNFKNDSEYANAIKFYRELSSLDGTELTLNHSSKISSGKTIYELFTIFLEEWVIRRQLNTRIIREKELAWFCYTSETNTYDWEHSYYPTIYRASRMSIFLSFLENTEIVTEYKDGWVFNRVVYEEGNI